MTLETESFGPVKSKQLPKNNTHNSENTVVVFFFLVALTVMASPDTVPSARVYPFIASVGDLTYLWGGLGDTEPEAVFIYCHSTETFMRRLTSGSHPPAGLRYGGCVMSGHHLYLYGGYDKNDHNCGNLYELNTQTWQWKKLCDGSAGGPGKKYGCRMISYQGLLLVLGGAYDEIPSSRQAGATYEKNVLRFGISVDTNEVHGYSLTSGKRSRCVGMYLLTRQHIL